jgi:AbrB family looped-hinge helix DNA binding protein
MEEKMTKVTAKYQITIPPAVRNELGIVPGSQVEIARKGNDFVIVVDPIDQLKKSWRGKFKGDETTDGYMDEIRGKVE